MSGVVADPVTLIDSARYPLHALDSEAGAALVEHQRAALASTGVALLPGFARPETVRSIARDAEALRSASAFLEDVGGTAYLEGVDRSYPEGHPRRTEIHSLTWVIARDVIPEPCAARTLYDWPALTEFVSRVLDVRPLHRMADPLGALNLTIMDDQHVQGWHYDNADFVVSMAIQASESGGLFECAPGIRTDDDEHYDDVAEVLVTDGGDRVVVYPMVPGTLMIFRGRHSLHRVSPVQGDTARIVALFAYDRTPTADSSAAFKMLRYGRTEPLTSA